MARGRPCRRPGLCRGPGSMPRRQRLSLDLPGAVLAEAEKTAAIAFVAGRAVAFGLDPEKQGVSVAIDAGGHYGLAVAGGFALEPELFPRSGPVGHVAGAQGEEQGFPVHMGEHEHLSVAVIDGDGGYEAVGAETDLGKQGFVGLVIFGHGPRLPPASGSW